jgi:hypothetical protein
MQNYNNEQTHTQFEERNVAHFVRGENIASLKDRYT